MKRIFFLISFLFLIAALAFAEGEGTGGIETIIATVWVALGGTVVTFLGWLAKKGTEWLKAHTALLSAAAENALEEKIYGLVTIVTRETMQTYVDAITTASADGKLTDLEKKTAFEMTANKSIKLLKEKGIDIAETLLTSLIEAAVNKLKGEKNEPSPTPPS